MANYIVCMILQRLVLPIFLAACCLFRPVGISLPYLILFFCSPFVPIATIRNLNKSVGRYLKTIIIATCLVILIEISFQIVMIVIGKDLLEKCSLLEKIFRHVGLIQLNDLTVISIIEWIIPEVIMLISSIIILYTIRQLTLGHLGSLAATASVETPDINDMNKYSNERYVLCANIALYSSLAALFLSSIFRPSIPGWVYIVTFLGAFNYWACYKELKKNYSIICRIVMFIIAIHILLYLAYQNPWPQEFFPPDHFLPRWFGFNSIYTSSCSNDKDIRVWIFNNDYNFDVYINPVALVLSYNTLGICSTVLATTKEEKKRGGAFGQLENGTHISRQVSLHLEKTPVIKKKLPVDRWRTSAKRIKGNVSRAPGESSMILNEKTPLMRKSTRRLRDMRKYGVAPETGIPLEALAHSESLDDEGKSKFWEHIVFALEGIWSIIYSNSYIFTNIAMMAWSIIYHSWLTFVLLIWANVLWMIPNQRKTMLRTSPFIVIYAQLLLLAQYLYGMDLTEDELPTTLDVTYANLKQIGFVKYRHLPCLPLLSKALFNVIFLITLRQMNQDRALSKQKSTLADMVAPLQVTVGAATSDFASKSKPKKSSEFITKAGLFLNSILIKTWILIIIVTIFLSAITGKHMTGFRIMYMALFLIFLLTFQISWSLWKRIMVGFWLTVIVYAMSILVLVYTYQFDRFPEYWKEYLSISEKLQNDMGLQIYKTKDLFLHLVNPTLIVIMTVLQLHYFHKKFLDLFEVPSSRIRDGDGSVISKLTSTNYGNFENASDEDTSIRNPNLPKEKKIISKSRVKYLLSIILRKSKMVLDYVWLFLELHLIKVILIYAFWICLKEVCALHAILVFFPVVALLGRTNFQILISRIISLVVSVFLLTKMIYQVEYINHNAYDVICNNVTNPDENNNADWFGLDKVDNSKGLADLLRSYILYLTIVTVHAIIVLSQSHKRFLRGKSASLLILFPKIVREDAEKDLPSFLKYMLNYGFYKFGIEICLIATVALIGSRMDLVACFYAFWLCSLYILSREKMSVVWPAYLWFTVISIPIQYLTIVGLPPGLCINYPWSDGVLRNLQKWAMLPDPSLYLQSAKLMFDFILLMLISRQRKVFAIEYRYDRENLAFPGGTNKSVVDDIDNIGHSAFANPMPDFVSFVRNWLDIFKRGVLLSFYWLTLAIVFLTGTNRVHLFSIGYLVGSFIFLWQGSDFYLRPIKIILTKWTYLIGYNVLVITIKALLQIAGCIFLDAIALNNCWFIQLLGISCIQKFGPQIPKSSSCTVPREDVGLVWDGICFAFLILQLRIFKSYYFIHIINESKASTMLASRGAELIEELRTKRMQEQADKENEILNKIKQKMDRIKATQQKMMEPFLEPKTHPIGSALLVRTHSMSSCAGYHTPIEDEVAGSVLNDGEVGSDLPSELNGFGLTPCGGSLLQAPSPSSAIMTVSLDGYLEPQRLSFGSPPGSELIPGGPSSNDDESFPVFSPPPYNMKASAEESTLSHTLIIQPPTIEVTNNIVLNAYDNIPPTIRQHRRQSSLNTVSWPDQGDPSVSPSRRRLSSTLNPPDELDDEGVSSDHLHPTIHRRQSSIGQSWVEDDNLVQHRRRSSCTSWYHDDDQSARTAGVSVSHHRRQSSWGPSELYYRQSIISTSSRSPTSYHESVRSGDYYMFHDLDENIEFDIVPQKKHEKFYGSSDADDERRRRYLTFSELLTKTIKQQAKENAKAERALVARRQSSLPDTYVGSERSGVRVTVSEPIQGKSTKNKDRRRIMDQPTPGTSSTIFADIKVSDDYRRKRDHDLSSDKSDTTDEGDGIDRKRSRILGSIEMGIAFVRSFFVSVTLRLNRVSRNYRFIMKVLAKEKNELKRSDGFGVGLRIGSSMLWAPYMSNTAFHTPSSESQQNAELNDGNVVDEQQNDNILEKQQHPQQQHPINDTTIQEYNKDTNIKDLPKHEQQQQQKQQQTDINMFAEEDELMPDIRRMGKGIMPPIERDKHIGGRKTSMVPEIRILAPSLERGLDESSEPYRLSSNDVTESNTELEVEDFSSKEHSTIVEFLIALWFAIVSHTDFVCYFMVFLNQINSASILSLPLPLMVFLWGTLTIPRPSKTFWITLIAYTQTVVLLKCVSQFDVLWWNQHEITPNQPLAAPRIVGVEKKKNYAAFDLALLLVVFFHRFMLKSMGLWKSSFVDPDVPEGTYKVNDYTDERTDRSPRTASPDIADEKTIVLSQGGTKVTIMKVDSEIAIIDNDDDLVHVTQVMEEPSNYFPSIIKLSFSNYFSNAKKFFCELIDGKSRISADVYNYMFFCDFINFLVLMFGFTSFGSSVGDGGVAAYLEENKVPITFLIMLILQFLLIIIDRALYLRKYMLGKIMFQFALVILIHIWMFFILPAVTGRSFNSNAPPVVWYLIKCFYLLFSAYQIRCGYPSRILGNFLTKNFSLVNLAAFKLFKIIPFLFELRTLMDWIWTDTSMTLFDWLKMEDIFGSIYQLRCTRQMEAEFPVPRGTRRLPNSKYMMGGFLLFGIVAIIWFPMAIFALGNTVGQANPPYEVQVTLKIGPYEPIYTMNALDNNIFQFTDNMWNGLVKHYSKDRVILTFLSSYEPNDAAAVVLGGNSTSTWNISPPDKIRLNQDLLGNATLLCRFKYTIYRTSNNKLNPGKLSEERHYEMKSDDPARSIIIKLLNNATTESFTLPQVFPKFLKVKNNGDLRISPQLVPEEYGDPIVRNYRNLTGHLYGGEDALWWEVKEDCNDEIYKDVLSILPYSSCDNLVIYTFSDKSFPQYLTSISGGGIIGAYTTFVIVIFSFIRSNIFSGSSSKIMFEELPFVDRIFQLCLDIYLVRESLEYALEEDLFAKLIFLYRSPETMIKWTRFKNETTPIAIDEDGDDDDEENNDGVGNDHLEPKVK